MTSTPRPGTPLPGGRASPERTASANLRDSGTFGQELSEGLPCPSCGALVDRSASRGTPRVYCSTACRRQAEQPRRQLQREIVRAREHVAETEQWIRNWDTPYARREAAEAREHLEQLEAQAAA